MKVVKNLVIGLLSCILIGLISLEVVSFNLKNILIDGIIKETIVTQLVSKDYNNPNNVISDEEINKITDDERVRELLKSKEIQDLLEKYLDTTVNSLTSEEDLNNINLERDMVDFLQTNKSTVEELIGQEITNEMIDEASEQIETHDLSNAYKQAILNTRNNMTVTEKSVLKGYSFLVSNTFKIIVLILILIDLLLIALLQKSFYKWIRTLSVCTLVSGIGIIIMSFAVKYIVLSYTQMSGFNMNSLLYNGIVLVCIGVIVFIIYTILDKIIKKKKEIVQ